MLKIEYRDATNIRVITTPDIEMELQEAFCFKVPGYKYMPSVRSGAWNGDKKLYNRATKQIYRGLLHSVLEFAKAREYPVTLNKEDFKLHNITTEEVHAFIDTLGIPEHFERRDYQIDAIQSGIRTGRRTMLSATGSGKSFIIYVLCRWYMERDKKILLIVPQTALVHQMCGDFKDYGYSDEPHKIYQGQSKTTEKPITVTTWQSIQKMDPEWYEDFDVVICDEVHGAKADVMTRIIESCRNADVRFGFTGTLDGAVLNKLVIEGLFGPVKEVSKSAELMEIGVLTILKIKAITLKYPQEVQKWFRTAKMTYAQEMDYITQNERRNKLISGMATMLKGNTIVLFNYIAQGKELHRLIKEAVGDTRPVYLIYGIVEGEERNEIRQEIEFEENAIIVASYKTFSTGINIKRLHNLILASPTKARITLLQAIGRILRLSEYKDFATLFDFSDDLSWKSKKNYTLLHFLERVKIYTSEKFNYTTHSVEFNP